MRGLCGQRERGQGKERKKGGETCREGEKGRQRKREREERRRGGEKLERGMWEVGGGGDAGMEGRRKWEREEKEKDEI